MINERQRLFLRQAQSDWAVFRRLRDQPVCHQLHYLQMSTEKLGRAHFWKDDNGVRYSHKAFVKFVQTL